MRAIRILIADDHNLFRRGLQRILSDYDDLDVIGEATNGQEAVEVVERLQPDIVLMDVGMPVMSGPEATYHIRTAHPETQVIMLTVSDKDEDLFAAIKAGARGYLLKNARTADLLEAIRCVHMGEAMIAPRLAVRVLAEFGTLVRGASETSLASTLSEREVEVLRLVAQGFANKEIAGRLNLSEHTVKSHLRNIMDKLHVRSRAHAAAYAVQAGLVRDVHLDDK